MNLMPREPLSDTCPAVFRAAPTTAQPHTNSSQVSTLALWLVPEAGWYQPATSQVTSLWVQRFSSPRPEWNQNTRQRKNGTNGYCTQSASRLLPLGFLHRRQEVGRQFPKMLRNLVFSKLPELLTGIRSKGRERHNC